MYESNFLEVVVDYWVLINEIKIKLVNIVLKEKLRKYFTLVYII